MSFFSEVNPRDLGFTGSMCASCGSVSMKRSGACELCVECGTSSGCS